MSYYTERTHGRWIDSVSANYTTEDLRVIKMLEKTSKSDMGQYEKGFADGVLSATPKWIDASKRLPDKEGNYIVYETQNEEVCESLYYPQARLKKDRWRDPWEGCSVFSVSHWMEMPEPPQEVKHEVDRC